MANDPIKLVTLGGLTYNANQVKKANDNGDGTFTISFKSGEVLTYPQQPTLVPLPKDEQYNGHLVENPKNPCESYNDGMFRPADPNVKQKIDGGLIWDDTYFDITDVMGAKFTSHKDTVSHVNLNDCTDCEIDLSANESVYYPDKAIVNGGSGNEVTLDERDIATIDGHIIKGQGTASQDSYIE